MVFEKLIRPHIKDLKPYSSARDEFSGEGKIFLDANENPFGSVTQDQFNRYPDPYQKKLKEKISKIKNVPQENIFLGNGSDEPIDLLIRLLCNPGEDSILINPPTYGMYEVSANINNVNVIKVPLTEEFDIDADTILESADQSTKIIFLCSPNNPTGNSLSDDQILKVIKGFKGIVVIDEAYIDFSSIESYSMFVGDLANLVILQTFSKAWGLAALRLGMAFAHSDLLYYLNKIKPPYNINDATQQLVLSGLGNIKAKNRMVAKVQELKEVLKNKLNDLENVEKVYPSEANFLLFKTENPKKLYDHLIQQEIVVRDRSKVALCEGCLRVTVGTEPENLELINAIENFNGEA